jgi:CubicO group peptidase (beta-lactamase class C family)
LLLGFALWLAALATDAAAQTDALPAIPSEAEIRKILAERIDVHKQSMGIVVGVIERGERRVLAHGRLGKDSTRPLDGDTLYEIGSITKVFTALLLTDMAQRGEVRLEDSIAKYLPAEVKVPQRDGRAITLVDLATHTSGLPRMPANFRSQDPANPYIDYRANQLYEYLASHELTRAIGAKYEYSNTGFGVLGHALARRAGVDYEALVEARICRMLGMASTRIALSPELRARLAVGHDADLSPVANWDFAVLAGTGALRSSANDMLTFLAANLGLKDSPLAEAMRAMLSVRRPAWGFFVDTALAWVVDTRGGGEIIWKNGGTGGYRSFIGYAAQAQRGVVVLSNATAEIDDIGLHLLDTRFRLAAPPQFPKEAVVGAKVLEAHVGRYELGSNRFMTITREGDRLFSQVTGQQRYRIYAMSDRKFFYKVVEAQITFDTDDKGRTIALVQHQNGLNHRAKRVEGDGPRRVR